MLPQTYIYIIAGTDNVMHIEYIDELFIFATMAHIVPPTPIATNEYFNILSLFTVHLFLSNNKMSNTRIMTIVPICGFHHRISSPGKLQWQSMEKAIAITINIIIIIVYLQCY